MHKTQRCKKALLIGWLPWDALVKETTTLTLLHFVELFGLTVQYRNFVERANIACSFPTFNL